jgi:hypothetical protein
MDKIGRCVECKAEIIQSSLFMFVKDCGKVLGAIDTKFKMYVDLKTMLIPERGYIEAHVTADSLRW